MREVRKEGGNEGDKGSFLFGILNPHSIKASLCTSPYQLNSSFTTTHRYPAIILVNIMGRMGKSPVECNPLSIRCSTNVPTDKMICGFNNSRKATKLPSARAWPFKRANAKKTGGKREEEPIKMGGLGRGSCSIRLR